MKRQNFHSVLQAYMSTFVCPVLFPPTLPPVGLGRCPWFPLLYFYPHNNPGEAESVGLAQGHTLYLLLSWQFGGEGKEHPSGPPTWWLALDLHLLSLALSQ